MTIHVLNRFNLYGVVTIDSAPYPGCTTDDSDPLRGSGSEIIGAMLAGWDAIYGIEIEPHYVEIAEKECDIGEKRRVFVEILSSFSCNC